MTKPIAKDELCAGDTDRLVLGRFLAYRLSILAETVSRAFAQHYEKRFGLTIPEWRIMAVLGERSPQSTQQIIERTQMDRVKVSRAAMRLEDKALIIRTNLPGDQRAHRLRLSRRGGAIYRQIIPLAHALQSALVQGFERDELVAFDSALSKLMERAERLAPVPEPGTGSSSIKPARSNGGGGQGSSPSSS